MPRKGLTIPGALEVFHNLPSDIKSDESSLGEAEDVMTAKSSSRENTDIEEEKDDISTRGRHPINPDRVQQFDDAIAATSTSSGASMLQQVRARSVAQTLSLPWSTVHKVLHHILRRFPHKIKMLQELKP
ncbi:uncharacterized protein TNCV_3171951 [Trichonephila clavipes]|nr:uncharacterized protein TNCV_3171951 [Trichonephila clavipes]